MAKLRVRLVFVKGEDMKEVEITTTKERINEDVGIVMHAMEEKGYRYLRGILEEGRDSRGSEV
ncbi:hypothetical protein [Thermococcus sp.]